MGTTGPSGPRVGGSPVVLLVEDDSAVSSLYARWLREQWTVQTAYDAKSAIAALDDDVCVVLVDRHLSGDEDEPTDAVVDAVRRRLDDCQVAALTSVAPEFDLTDTPFDDVLVKPVTRTRLQETVRELLLRSAYDDRIREYYSLAREHARRETESSPPAVAGSGDNGQLTARKRELRESVDDIVYQLSDHESCRRIFATFQSRRKRSR